MSKPKRTQKTKQGYEIPVPKKDEVLGWIKKAAKGRGGSGDSAKK